MEAGDSQRPSCIPAKPSEDDRCDEGDWAVDYSCNRPSLAWLPTWPWLCVAWNECNPGLGWAGRHRRPLLVARFVVLVVGVVFGCLAFLGVSDKPAIITSLPWGIVTHTVSNTSDLVLATFWSNLWGECVGLNNVTFHYIGAPPPDAVETLPLMCMSFGSWAALHGGALPESWNCNSSVVPSSPFCGYFLTGYPLSAIFDPKGSDHRCHQHNSSTPITDCQTTASDAPSSHEDNEDNEDDDDEEEDAMEQNEKASDTTRSSNSEYWSEAYGSCASSTTAFVTILSVSLAMNVLKVAGSFTRCTPEDDHNAKCFNLLSSGLPFLIQSSTVLAKYAECYIPIENSPGQRTIFAVGVGMWCALASISCNAILFVIDMIIPSGPTRYIKRETPDSANAIADDASNLPEGQEMARRDYGPRRTAAGDAVGNGVGDGAAAAVSLEAAI